MKMSYRAARALRAPYDLVRSLTIAVAGLWLLVRIATSRRIHPDPYR